MKITVAEARKRLAKAGIELGHKCTRSEDQRAQSYEVTTPVGTTVHMQTAQIAGLLRDMDQAGMQI